MKLAVLIPCYNCERYLSECLDSVFAAAGDYVSRGPENRVDILCGLDGPTDGTEAVLDEWRLKHADALAGGRISVLKSVHPNIGVSATRNDLLDRVSTDVDAVCFVDSDDTIQPCMLSSMAGALARMGADVAECIIAHDRSLLYRGDGSDLPDKVTSDMFSGAWINIVNKLYRRSIIGAVRFRTGLYFEEDNFFNREVNRIAKSKVAVPAFLYFYRDNPNSATGSLDFGKYVSSVVERVRLTLEIFGPSAELAEDAYRMMIRKNLRKNKVADERRRYFDEASQALVRYEREYGLRPVGLNLIQRLIWVACRDGRYWLARGLVFLT